MVGTPPFYMLGACIFSEKDNDTLAKLEKLLPYSAKKLHWRDMAQKTQRESLEILSESKSSHIVIIASSLNRKKQERARRKCLEVILPLLEQRGVGHLILESRGAKTDALDLSLAKYAKGAKLISTIKINHEDGTRQKKFWIADQILGAMGDYLAQTNNWKYWETEWQRVSQLVERIDITL